MSAPDGFETFVGRQLRTVERYIASHPEDAELMASGYGVPMLNL